MERSLEGRTALVTGSTSGIGRGIALAFARAWAKILLHGLGAPGQVDKVRAELAEVTGGEVAYSAADLSDAREVRKMCAQAEEVLGHVDILVNNAGIQFTSPVEQFPEEKWDQIIAINLSSAFHATAALLPGMRKAGWGRIINVTTSLDTMVHPTLSAYGQSKAALEAFSDVTGTETVSDHVTFSNVRLPLVKTRMIAPTEAYDNQPGTWNVDRAAARVLHAIIDRPKRVDSLVGLVAEIGHRVTPGLTTRILHQEYLVFGESAAALGRSDRDAGGRDA